MFTTERKLAAVLLLTAAACAKGGGPDAPADEYGHQHQAVWVNGDLESDAIGVTPPTGWTVTTYLNSDVTGSAASPPLTESALNLGGTSTNETFVVGGTAGTQTDPDLGTGQTFRYPRFGVRAARVNYQNATNNGSNQNVNALRQTMTIGTGDIDPVDGQIHVRFAVAPVLENPSHSYVEQPYYFVALKNLTKGTQLYSDFNTAGQPGVPWKTTTSIATSNPTLWTDWQLVDVSGDAGLSIGDQVQLTVIGAGCSLGAHFGRVYVDGLGSTVPGLYTWATGPSSAPAGTSITYTLNYRNGGTSAALGSVLDFTTPPNTTFVSTTGTGCTTPAGGSAGTVSCALGTLQPGATGSYTVTVLIGASATGYIIMGNYAIRAANASPLLGSKVVTQITGAGTQYADISVTNTDGVAQTNWGQGLTYTVVVKNNGAVTATGVDVTDTMPSQLTGVTWTCARSTPAARCTASGSGNIADTVTLPAGATVTYTINATVIAGSGSGTIAHKVTASAANSLVDPVSANNSALDVDQIGTPRTLTVTKTGVSAGGTVMVAPVTSAQCGTGCSSATGTYADGTSVVLSIIPASGYSFTGWGGACASAGAATNCTITMSGNQSVSAGFALIPPPGTATQILVYAGDPQSAQVSKAFAAPLQAFVADANGTPVANATVTFTTPASGASAALSGATAVTNASGVATVSATANATTGAYQVTASVAGVVTTAKFNLTNVGAPASFSYIMGGTTTTRQGAAVGATYGTPLVAAVLDSAGRPVPGVTVTLTPPATGASVTLSATTVVTDSAGQFSVTATANATAGTVNVTAATTGVTSLTFGLRNNAVTATQLIVVSGTPQATDVNTAFSGALVVSATDAAGNPVANVTVTFTRPATGASATLSSLTATTDASGVARVNATANGTAGTYNVTATAAGTTTATFVLTNNAVPPPTIAVVGGSAQTARVTTAFAQPLVVTLTSSQGLPVSGVTVTFAAPASGASATLSSTTAVTDANGQAQVTATANATTGNYSVSATAAGYTGPATFSLSNVTWNLSTVSGTPQYTLVNTSFASALVVQVLDSNAAPVPGVTLTFAAPGSGPSATLSSTTATTDATGQASITATANTVAGGYYNVTASAATVVGTSTFALTNRPGTASAVTVYSGTPQTTPVNKAFAAPLIAQVVDAYGNGVPGVQVTFAAPASGPTTNIVPPAPISDAAGRVAVNAGGGTVAGAFTVTASASGVAGQASFALTHTPGAPSTASISSGTPQTRVVATAFSPLAVQVFDAFGNAVPGVSVAFSGPATGAGATFASSATTNAQGRTSLPATANTVAGSYAVTATVPGVAGALTFSLTNVSGPAASITVTGGSGQSAMVNTAFANPLAVQVSDAYGNPVSGVGVLFNAPVPPGVGATFPGGGWQRATTTDASGRASTVAFAGTKAGGPYSVTATTSGATDATFALTNLPGNPAAINLVSGSPQHATVTTAFPGPLVVRVTDAFGNVVPAATVSFAAPSGGASATLASTSATTDASGTASVTAAAGTLAGTYAVTGSVAGVTGRATFALTNDPGAAENVVTFSGTPQSAMVGTAFGAALVAQVTDHFGNGVPGISVTFSAPSGGASAALAPSSANTDAAGKATVNATAGTVSGAYSVTASVSGLAATATFSLTNTPGAPASITAFSGTPQTATVGTAFTSALVAQVKDSFGNAIPSVSVAFSAPSGGATATITTSPATTDATGKATVNATAGTVSGAYSVTGSVSGLASTATFSLTNTPGAPASITAFSGTPQATTVGAAFGAALVAQVKDSFGNAIPSASVAFSAPSSGATATIATSPATTDASGQATVNATAATVSGAYSITASVSGLASTATFSLTNNPGAPASITAVAGTPQRTTVGTAFTAALVAQVKDSFGNAIPSISVNFSAPSSGATATIAPTPATTDVAGKATVNATAGTVSGIYTVAASVTGLATTATFTLRNNAGSAATIAVVSGTPLSTTVGTRFKAELIARVTDNFGNAVEGALVTFSWPATGATLILTNSGTLTDQNGFASTSPIAGTVSGTFSVTASTPGVATPATFTLTNLPGAAAAISADSGTPQSAVVNTAFADALVAKVVDEFGNAVPDASVTFAAPGSSATATMATSPATTDAAGKATVSATAGTVTGAYTVAATVPGVRLPANFALTNLPGAPAALVALSGTPQAVTVNTAFAAPLVAKVTDAFDNAVPGVTVTFAPPATGAKATLSAATATTDAAGKATVNATAGTVAGAYDVVGSVSMLTRTAKFTLTNKPGAPATITAVAGSPQATTVGTAFASPLVVKIADAFGNAVPGIAVTFDPPATGATATLSGGSQTTDAAGLATIDAVAGTVSGTYTVSASVSMLTQTAAFALTNDPGAAAAIAAFSGSPQHAAVNAAFGASLVAKVTDSFGNAVPGVSVIFDAPTTGATAVLGGSPATTDAAGKATITATAGTVAGAYDVTANALGVASGAAFRLTNDPGAPTKFVALSGTPQHVEVATAFAAPLVALLTDAFDNAVPGVAIGFTAPATGATAALSGTSVLTDAAGKAQVTATAGNTAGAYDVLASVSMLTGKPKFTLTNDPGAPASLTVVSGTPQTTTVATAFGAPLVVKVADRFGNAVPAVSVAFAAPVTGATATTSAGSVTTGADGKAQVTATAGETAGAYDATASVSMLTEKATFSLKNTAGTAVAISTTTGTPQQTGVNAAFGAPLVATVTDRFGNPVPGATVTLTPPASGAGATLSATTVTTDANGRISVTATANATAGGYDVGVSVAGVATPAKFSLTNVPGAAKRLVLVSGDGQHATVDADYAQALVVKALDADGNAVPGATIAFAAPTAGATATLNSVSMLTESDGKATVTAHASRVSGAFQVTAALGTGAPVTFALANDPDVAVAFLVTPETATQSTTVDAAFPAELELAVVDRFGNPVPDAHVTFAAPADGATAQVPGTTQVSGPDGKVRVPATASATAGTYPVTAGLEGGTDVLATFTLTNLPGAPVSATIESGSPAGTPVHTAFDEPLVVIVRDAHGNPVPGAQVTFATPGSGPSATLDAPVVTTGPDGRATVHATANDEAGTYTVNATVAGGSQPATFDLTNIPGDPVRVEIEPGASPQSAQVGTGFGVPLKVTVYDAYGNPVPGATIEYGAPEDGATARVADGSVSTGADGSAQTTATASETTGAYTVTAKVAGTDLSVTFELTNLAGGPAKIAITGGATQSTTVATPFAEPLALKVTDAFGNAVTGTKVAFAGPTTGARATFDATAMTDATGAAAVNATAGEIAGAYEVTATVAGASAPVVFHLTNLPGAPAKLTAIPGGTPQSAVVRQPFAHGLDVLVTDQFGNAVPRVTVAYAAPDEEPTAIVSARTRAEAVTTTTGTDGIATVSAIAGRKTGPYAIVATVDGVAAPLEFHLTNTAAAPATIALVSGGGQTTEALTAFADPVVLAVKDAEGNAVPGVAVTFAADSLTAGGATETDADGAVSLTVTAGAKVGAAPATVGAEGVAAPVVVPFTVTAIPTRTALAVPAELVSVSEKLHLVSTTTASHGAPAGTVHFFADALEIGQAAVGADGKAVLDVEPPSPGTRVITAKFTGSEPYADSASDGASVEIEDNVLKGGGGCASAGPSVWALVALALVLGARRRSRA